MGGRGSSSYSSPPGSGGGGNTQAPWSDSALMPLLPESGREAIGKKGRAIGVKAAYEGANPFWSSDYREFSENCQRCVVAYELRRRGYDVTAQPTHEGDKLPYVMWRGKDGKLRQGAWTSAFKHARPENVGARKKSKVAANVEEKMKQYGNGSRAVISIAYQNKYGGGGHVFNVENRSGKIWYVDAQTGERYNPKNVFDYVKPGNVTLTRVDNLRISGKINQFVWREKP